MNFNSIHMPLIESTSYKENLTYFNMLHVICECSKVNPRIIMIDRHS